MNGPKEMKIEKMVERIADDIFKNRIEDEIVDMMKCGEGRWDVDNMLLDSFVGMVEDEIEQYDEDSGYVMGDEEELITFETVRIVVEEKIKNNKEKIMDIVNGEVIW